MTSARVTSKNLRGFTGDFVAADVARLDWQKQFKELAFDAIFHEASITDATEHDQLLQAHDSIEDASPPVSHPSRFAPTPRGKRPSSAR